MRHPVLCCLTVLAVIAGYLAGIWWLMGALVLIVVGGLLLLGLGLCCVAAGAERDAAMARGWRDDEDGL